MQPPYLAVVVPTFQRPRLLARSLRRLERQGYANWSAVIVHDGPDADFDRLAARYAGNSKFVFLKTDARANDCGNTPRLVGLSHLLSSQRQPDYALLWDDDDLFFRTSLQDVAATALSLELPDFFLVGMEVRGLVIPPAEKDAASLTVSEVCTINMVGRTAILHDAYREIVDRFSAEKSELLLISDYLVFDHIRELQKNIPIARNTVVGFVDGLRLKPWIRRMLGLSSVTFADKPWVRQLTFGRYRSRPAGGLEL